jgi:hypothetical protein
MPPALRNHRPPTASDTPVSLAASSVERSTAIDAKNRWWCSRRAAGGRPGDRNGTRSHRSQRRSRVAVAILLLESCDDRLNSPKQLVRFQRTLHAARRAALDVPQWATVSKMPCARVFFATLELSCSTGAFVRPSRAQYGRGRFRRGSSIAPTATSRPSIIFSRSTTKKSLNAG